MSRRQYANNRKHRSFIKTSDYQRLSLSSDFGDGLHSRGFETEVRNYLLSAGFVPDIEGFETLEAVPTRHFKIRDPFFFTKKEG